MTKWMTPEENRAMHRRARRLGQRIDWDGADEHETTKVEWAEAFERKGMHETAAELRAEYWAEAAAKEEAEASSRHERRSAAAKRAAQTRARNRAERAAAVAAAEALLADERHPSS